MLSIALSSLSNVGNIPHYLSNMEEIKSYLEEYDPIIVNRLETQTRQPSLYFSACLIDHQQSYEIMKLLI